MSLLFWLLAIAAGLFPTEIAISRESGGGGNRTRVTCPTDSPLSSENVSGASDDEPRPPLVTARREVGRSAASTGAAVSMQRSSTAERDCHRNSRRDIGAVA